MKFNFKIQPFQTEAVDAVVRVFQGQPKRGPFGYSRGAGETDKPENAAWIDEYGDLGYGNADLSLSGEQLLKNIRQTQMENNISPSPGLVKGLGAVSLDVEMETGTGKTYVYIKTMLELHERFGWGKFIVVVPSVAIREGVKKSFEMTQENFMEQYGKKARFFVYNSSNLHQLDEFSSGTGINVMIINMQAFNTSLKEGGKSKESRKIYEVRDEFGSRRPIDVIKATRPIIIMDEPQKMGGAATQDALKNNFNPLFSLNYSATHKNSHNLVYVLDALDAFRKKIVKKIEVKGFQILNLRGTEGYLYLSGILVDPKKPPRARLEFEKKYKSKIARETRLFNEGDSLYEKSNELEAYKGLYVTEVSPQRGYVSFSDGTELAVGSALGNVAEADIRRIQIRETIQSHFDKEEALFRQGIKCLSLFFIDEVAKYRQYDAEGREVSGEYARVFEEEYAAALAERVTLFSDEYRDFLKVRDVGKSHRGYFSIDKDKTNKQERMVNSATKRGSDLSDDITAYDLILKNKERLLSFDEHTRFIFSHSALREGWDNPNVFQICTLKQSGSATGKRQEVGRGLRLCVNRAGDRQDLDSLGDRLVHDVNRLTVIASESYAAFVKDLQTAIEEDLYTERPKVANVEYFSNKTIIAADGSGHTLNENEARAVYNYLAKNDYIDDYTGAIKPKYRMDLEGGSLAPLREELAPLADGIHALVQGIYDPSIMTGMVEDGHATKLRDNPLNENAAKREFKELWNAINRRYTYRVDFSSGDLIEKSTQELNDNLRVAEIKYILKEGEQTGAEFKNTHTKQLTVKPNRGGAAVYDLIGKIARGAKLTRRSAAAILLGLRQEKLMMFQRNPEEFIKRAVDGINSQKAAIVVNKISYHPSGEEPYSTAIFNMGKSSFEYSRAFKANKAVQDYVFTQGTSDDNVERRFADRLDKAYEVEVYAKLPSGPKGFYIPTPVGNYSPDWAIAFKVGAVKHIFFIAETKGSMDNMQLRRIENAKIGCAKKLFNELSHDAAVNPEKVRYHNVDSYKTLLAVMRDL